MYVQVQVHDNQDGTYSLTYSLPSEGPWVLSPHVDGVPLRQQGFPVTACFGALHAQDVFVSLQQQDGGHVCGSGCRLHIKVSKQQQLWFLDTHCVLFRFVIVVVVHCIVYCVLSIWAQGCSAFACTKQNQHNMALAP